MKRRIVFFAVLSGMFMIGSILSLQAGCGTPAGNITLAAYHRIITIPDQSLRELQPAPKLYHGVYLGIIRKPGINDPRDETKVIPDMEYYHLQFSNCLQGSNRNIRINIPVRLFEEISYNPNGTIEEIDTPLPKGDPAFLYIGDLSKVTKDDKVKAHFMQTYDIPQTSWAKYPVVLETGEDMQTPVPGSGDTIYLRYPLDLYGRYYALSPVKLKFKRVVRSKVSLPLHLFGGYASMLITIPLDIVSSPVQLVLWARGMAH